MPSPYSAATASATSGLAYAPQRHIEQLCDGSYLMAYQASVTQHKLVQITNPSATPTFTTLSQSFSMTADNMVGDLFVLNNGTTTSDVWFTWSDNGNSTGLFVAHGTYTASGSSWSWDNTSTSIGLGTLTGGLMIPSVVWTGSNLIVACRGVATDYGVGIASTTTKNGSTGWSSLAVLDTTSGNSHAFPLLRHDATNGCTLCVYALPGDTVKARVIADSSSPTVANWSSAVALSGTVNVGAANLSATLDTANKRLHVAYMDSGTSTNPQYNNATYTTTSISAGTSFNTGTGATTSTGAQIGLDSASPPNAYLFWASAAAGSAGDIMYVKLASPYGSGNLGSVTNLTNGTSTDNAYPHVPANTQMSGYAPLLYAHTVSAWAIEYDNSIAVAGGTTVNTHHVAASGTLALAQTHHVAAQATLAVPVSHAVSTQSTLALAQTHATHASATLALLRTHSVANSASLALLRSHAVAGKSTLALAVAHGVRPQAVLSGGSVVRTHGAVAAASLALITPHGVGGRVAISVAVSHAASVGAALAVVKSHGAKASAALGVVKSHAVSGSALLALARTHGVSAQTSLIVVRIHAVGAVANIQAATGTGIGGVSVSTQTQSWPNSSTGAGSGTETDVTYTDNTGAGWAVGLIPSYGGMPISSWYQVNSNTLGTNQISLSTTVSDGAIHWLNQNNVGTFAGSEDKTFTMVEQAPTGTSFRRYYKCSFGPDANGFNWVGYACIYPGDPGLIAYRFDQINPTSSAISLAGADGLEIALIAGLQQSDSTWAYTNGGYGTLAGGNTTPWPVASANGTPVNANPDYVYITPASGSGVALGRVTVLQKAVSALSPAWGSPQLSTLGNTSRLKLKVQGTVNTFPGSQTSTAYMLWAFRRNLNGGDAYAIAADYINPGSPTVSVGAFTNFSYDERAYVYSANATNQLTTTLDLTPSHVTVRYKPVLKVTGWTAVGAPTLTWGGTALVANSDYRYVVDAPNNTLYLQLYFDVVASGASGGQRNNASLVLVPAPVISTHAVAAITPLALLRTHGVAAAANLSAPHAHGARAGATLGLARSHGAASGAALTYVRTHASGAGVALALARSHAAAGSVTLTTARTHALGAAGSLALARSHAASAALTLTVPKTHPVAAAVSVANIRTHSVVAGGSLALLRSHAVTAGASLALARGHAATNSATLALARTHGIHASGTLALAHAHAVTASTCLALIRLHSVHASVTLQSPVVVNTHGVAAAATLIPSHTHNVAASGNVAYLRTHGAATGASIAYVRTHAASGSASLALARAHGVGAGANVAYLRAHAGAASASLALARSHASVSSASVAYLRSHSVGAHVTLQSAVSVNTHAAAATATLTAPHIHAVRTGVALAYVTTHGVSAGVDLAYLRQHALGAAVSLAYARSHHASASATLALAPAHGVAASTALLLVRAHAVGALACVTQPIRATGPTLTLVATEVSPTSPLVLSGANGNTLTLSSS